MKTFFSLIIFSATVFNVAKSQTSFGIKGGATFSSYKIKAESVSTTSKTKVGFTGGLVAPISLSKDFVFRPELNFVQKGGKVKQDDYTDKLTLNYIELPLNFVYNVHAAKNILFFGAGPSLSYGISGKDKWHDNMESGGGDIKFGGSSDDDFKALEVGANFLAGYQLAGGFFITANYNAAINNIAPKDPGFDAKYHNRYFSVGIGVIFNNKHSKPSVEKQ